MPAKFSYDMYLYAMLLLSLADVLSFLHQGNRRSFVLLICSIDSCCSTTYLFCDYFSFEVYSIRTPSVSYVVFRCLLLYERVSLVVPDGRWMCFFFLRCPQRFIHFHSE